MKVKVKFVLKPCTVPTGSCPLDVVSEPEGSEILMRAYVAAAGAIGTAAPITLCVAKVTRGVDATAAVTEPPQVPDPTVTAVQAVAQVSTATASPAAFVVSALEPVPVMPRDIPSAGSVPPFVRVMNR